MSFIKVQKLVRNEAGTILSGSAAIVDTVYVKTGNKNHSKQVVRERLAKANMHLFVRDMHISV